MELKRAQELYNQSLCIFPNCTAVSSKIPVKKRDNLDEHIRNFSGHNTPEAVAYKQRLIGVLTYKYHNTTKLVSICSLFIGHGELFHQGI
jgi:hypothetical protein